MQHRKSALSIGDQWSKVNQLPVTAEKCTACTGAFTLLKRKHTCRCGYYADLFGPASFPDPLGHCCFLFLFFPLPLLPAHYPPPLFPSRMCGHPFCRDCVFRSIEVYPDGPDAAKVDVLHPEHERPNGVALLGCERCLKDLEKATHLHERLAFGSVASDSSQEAQALRLLEPSSVFVRVMELYNTRLFRARNGAIVTLGLFQDTIEAMRGDRGRAGAGASASDSLARSSSVSSSASTADPPTSPNGGAGGKSLVRTAVKYQADLDYYYEEMTTVAHRVRRGFLVMTLSTRAQSLLTAAPCCPVDCKADEEQEPAAHGAACHPEHCDNDTAAVHGAPRRLSVRCTLLPFDSLTVSTCACCCCCCAVSRASQLLFLLRNVGKRSATSKKFFLSPSWRSFRPTSTLRWGGPTEHRADLLSRGERLTLPFSPGPHGGLRAAHASRC